MYMKFLFLFIVMFPSLTFAGNPLQSECDKSYYHSVVIQGINVISNWQESGPAVNVKVNGIWYAKEFSDSANDGFYQLAYLAYISQSKVNVCVGEGVFRGLEFS